MRGVGKGDIIALREMSAVELASLTRATKQELRRHAAYFADLEVLDAALTALSVPVMIVNDYRQIVYANRAAADLVGVDEGRDLIGARPGEALGCVYAEVGEGGCGTSPFCHYCGAARAIVESEEQTVLDEELRVVRGATESPPALDLRITSRAFSAEGHAFTVLTMIDISHEKRRQALERIFFHDILNTVQKLRIAVDLIDEVGGEDRKRLLQVTQKAVQRLNQEIQAQRDLTDMESRELVLRPREVRSLELLKELVESYLDRNLTHDHLLWVSPETKDVTFITDPVKMRRVLDNLIRNALEADDPGSTITVGCRLLDDGTGSTPADAELVEFWVHNQTVMPEPVQRQVFQRSFTTKGRGRGLGTYSVKLLTERYLEGEVAFISRPGEGTVFRVRYPLKPSYADSNPSERSRKLT